ncbi:MAG: DUF3892 domain-containing protein [Nitrosospira sp.]
MSKLQIRCVNKADRGMPHERIRCIGGFYANGSSWKFSQEEAIQKIEEGSCCEFHGHSATQSTHIRPLIP